MLILCRSLLFPAQKYTVPLEMIQRQVTRMIKIMQWHSCKEQCKDSSVHKKLQANKGKIQQKSVN